MLFLGGNKLDGYFFECLSLADEGDAVTEVLDKTLRIFRQPVQGIFSPKLFNYVGFAERKFLPTHFCFRLLEDNSASDKIGKFSNMIENNNWLYILDKIVNSGSDELSCNSTLQYQVTINAKGKVKWGNLLPLSINKTTQEKDVPMPFGSILDYNKLNSIFVDNINELNLIDKAYK